MVVFDASSWQGIQAEPARPARDRTFRITAHRQSRFMAAEPFPVMEHGRNVARGSRRDCGSGAATLPGWPLPARIDPP